MLFHARTYDDPVNAGGKYYLPCVEVWSLDGKAWHVQYSTPGCLPEGEAYRFTSATAAIKEAYGCADLDWAALFRRAYQGSLARLRGSIALALEEEKAFESLALRMDVMESDGLEHVEELAHEVARTRFAVSQ